MIRRKFDHAIQQETGRFDDGTNLLRRHAQLRARSAGLPQNRRFFPRAGVPVDNGENGAGFQDTGDLPGQGRLLGHTVKSIGQEA